MYPTKLAIVKCKAQKKGNHFVIRSNNVADEAAEKVLKCTIPILTAPIVIIESVPQPEDIRMQE